MSTRIFNLNISSAPIPGPNFLWSRGPDGKCTGRHTFTLLRGAMGQSVNQARFAKGTPITSLDTTFPDSYSFLLVESFEVQSLPGGYEEVSVEVAGYTDEGDFEFDRETTYSSDCTLVERPILSNPNFISQVSISERRAIARIFNGLARGDETITGEAIESVFVYDNVTDEEIMIITDPAALEWYELIFIEGHRTYRAPHYEWQKSSANAGGLSDTELIKLGKIDSSPDGSPPSPPGEGDWLKTRAADTRGENSATKDENWEFGEWPERIYGD